MSCLLAAWTLGSVKACVEAGASSLTYFETVGPRGLIANAGAALRLSRRAGQPVHVHSLFRELARWKGAEIVACRSSVAGDVIGLALEVHGETRLLAANLASRPLSIAVPPVEGRAGAGRVVGEACLGSGRKPALELEPYAVATLLLAQGARRINR